MTTAQIEFFIGSWHENRYLVVGGFSQRVAEKSFS